MKTNHNVIKAYNQWLVEQGVNDIVFDWSHHKDGNMYVAIFSAQKEENGRRKKFTESTSAFSLAYEVCQQYGLDEMIMRNRTHELIYGLK